MMFLSKVRPGYIAGAGTIQINLANYEHQVCWRFKKSPTVLGSLLQVYTVQEYEFNAKHDPRPKLSLLKERQLNSGAVYSLFFYKPSTDWNIAVKERNLPIPLFRLIHEQR